MIQRPCGRRLGKNTPYLNKPVLPPKHPHPHRRPTAKPIERAHPSTCAASARRCCPPAGRKEQGSQLLLFAGFEKVRGRRQVRSSRRRPKRVTLSTAGPTTGPSRWGGIRMAHMIHLGWSRFIATASCNLPLPAPASADGRSLCIPH